MKLFENKNKNYKMRLERLLKTKPLDHSYQVRR
jgi:hypothetical protein